jgi:WD40 repeat protein
MQQGAVYQGKLKRSSDLASGLSKGRNLMKRALIPLLVILGSVMIIVALGISLFYPQARTHKKVLPTHGAGASVASSTQYLYYALKKPQGFMLARAVKGPDGRPLGNPQPLTLLDNGFGQAESDNISILQLSPDGRYLAVDGSRDHGDLVWIYDTLAATLKLMPPAIMGNFLHWLPGKTADIFLYRPMFPAGPDAPLDNGVWNPGLWLVDAATGLHQNINIGVPSAFLIDAAPSPDGSQIVYSTTSGLGKGSDTWRMNRDGHVQTLLFHIADGSQDIAGLFAWSPDGTSIAYERLSDSATPFLPASLWLMDNHGETQRHLTDVDGGHGFAPSWSPDGSKIAFVVRTNVGDHQADTLPQTLQCAIGVVTVGDGHAWLVASSQQTAKPWNINPTWTMDSRSITFTALDPVNRVVGGTPRYWSAHVIGPQEKPLALPVSPVIPHVVAVG